MSSKPLIVLYSVIAVLLFCHMWSAIYFVLLGFDFSLLKTWSFIELYWKFGHDPEYESKFIISGIVSVLIPTGLGVLWLTTVPKSYFGDARWASRSEIKKGKLLDSRGLLLGKRGSHFIVNDEPAHVLVTAPTRSGKGVGLVIPNLLSWSHSAIILDIKHENFEETSGHRARHQDVYLFAPASEDGKSHRFNPLDTIRRDQGFRIADVQRMAAILLPSGKGEASMWTEEARDLFIGLALYVLDNPNVPGTIGEIYRTLKTEHDLADVLRAILSKHEHQLSQACVMAFHNFVNKAPKEQSGVKSTLSSTLNLWSIPSVDAVTSASDFRIEDLRRKAASVYFGVGLNQLTPMARLVRLFFELSVDVLTRNQPKFDEPHQVLMLIDEFGSLGPMPVIAKNLPFVAGYGIRIMNIIQGIGQLDAIYGRPERENILQNSAIQIFFAANDITTTQYVSQTFGNKTIQTESVNYGQGTMMGSKSHSYTKSEFMRPDEFRRFCRDNAVIFKEGMRPVKVAKIVYYEDKVFTQRLYKQVDIPELIIADMVLPVFDVKSMPKDVDLEGKKELRQTKEELVDKLSDL